MRRQLMLAIVMGAWISVASAGTVVISDETFENADWSARTDGSAVFAGGNGTSGTQIPIGGNPGSYREIQHSGQKNGISPGAPSIAWHLFEASPYDPANGAILSVDFSEDILRTLGPEQIGRLALRQDDILFRSKTSYAIDALNAWENNTLSDLESSDFEALFNGNIIPTAHPDFGVSGEPIVFGVYRETSIVPRGVFDRRTGLDNWTITLTTESIPEPQSLLMGVLGLASWAIFRQIRTRRPLIIIS